jgi:AcrR family transcriptional regulator
VQPKVAHSEREWILIGMAECCATRGYEATTVADVCSAAGVSPGSFEEVFADKAECVGAAMESLVEEAWRRLDEVNGPGKQWAAALRDGVSVLLAFLSERPAFAHMALLEAPAAEGRAGALYRSGKAALLAFLERGRQQSGAAEHVPETAARGALAGAETLVVGELLAGRAERLSMLAADIAYLLAVPYLGQEEAARLSAAPNARPRLRAVA